VLLVILVLMTLSSLSRLIPLERNEALPNLEVPDVLFVGRHKARHTESGECCIAVAQPLLMVLGIWTSLGNDDENPDMHPGVFPALKMNTGETVVVAWLFGTVALLMRFCRLYWILPESRLNQFRFPAYGWFNLRA